MEPKINKGERKMAKLKLTANNILTCILYVVVGALLCFAKGDMLSIMLTVIGVLFLALGIYDLIKGRTVNGIVEAVVGVVILICGWTIVDLVLLIFGVLLIIKGVVYFLFAQNLPQTLLTSFLSLQALSLSSPVFGLSSVKNFNYRH